jgi:hypothetical protein
LAWRKWQRGLSGNKPRQACLVVAWRIRDETYKTLGELGAVVPFLVAARALIRWFLAKRLFRCLSCTRPL